MTNFLDIPIQVTLAEKGLDSFGQSPLRFSGSEINQKAQTMFDAGVPSNFIQDGDTIVRLNVVDGYLQSGNFVAASAGWQIKSNGDVEFNNGVFRGTLTAASGSLGAITIGTNAWHVDSSGNMWWGNYATYALALIKISAAGEVTFTTGNFSGTLNAPSGTLGTITGGTITGALIQTAATGLRTKLSSNNLEFYSDNTLKGFIHQAVEGGKSIVIGSADDFYLTDLNGVPLFQFTSGWNFNMNAGTVIQMPNRKIEDGGDRIQVDGYFRTEGYKVRPASTTYDGQTLTSLRIITNVYSYQNGADKDLRKKYRDVDFRNGIITSISDEVDALILAKVWNG